MKNFLAGFVLGAILGASFASFAQPSVPMWIDETRRNHLLREQNQILRDLRDQDLRTIPYWNGSKFIQTTPCP